MFYNSELFFQSRNTLIKQKYLKNVLEWENTKSMLTLEISKQECSKILIQFLLKRCI